MAGLRGILAMSALFALACEPLVDDGGGPGGGGVKADSASVRVVNSIRQDPGPMKLVFFAHDVASVQGAPVRYATPAVPQDSSRVFKVPAGIWKLAREDAAGDRFALTELGSADWPRLDVRKDESYFVILRTDSGNNNVWDTDIHIIP